MSRIIENRCVDCGLPCLGNACPYRNVSTDYCDYCFGNKAKYRIGNRDICEDCASKIIKETFDDLSLLEQAEAVDIDLGEIND